MRRTHVTGLRLLAQLLVVGSVFAQGRASGAVDPDSVEIRMDRGIKYSTLAEAAATDPVRACDGLLIRAQNSGGIIDDEPCRSFSGQKTCGNEILRPMRWHACKCKKRIDPVAVATLEIVASVDVPDLRLTSEAEARWVEEDARRIAEEAKARDLAAQAEREAWKEVVEGKCRAPKASTDCAPVERYLTQFPQGAHSSEATKLLKSASGKIAALRAAGERRAKTAPLTTELCNYLSTLDTLDYVDRFERRVDAASGTVDLAQMRQRAFTRVVVEDGRDKVMKRLADMGVAFNRNRDCKSGK